MNNETPRPEKNPGLTKPQPVSGLLLLNKPPGLTSFEALNGVKRTIGSGKAGHTGTLDKFASGLLLVLTGRALKLSPWFSHCDKQYEGTIRFGVETDTLDPEGQSIAEASLPEKETVTRVLSQFIGTIMQSPPEYSAIHINGKRASALARAGAAPQMEKRPVCIYKLELLEWQPPFARIFVHCSSGTYIRSLARDIALASGSRAHLSALVRTRVASFRLEDAQSENQLPCPISKAVFDLLELPWFEIETQGVKNIIHGKPLSQILDEKTLIHGNSVTAVAEKRAAGIFCGDDFIAMIEKVDGNWKYGFVYANN